MIPFPEYEKYDAIGLAELARSGEMSPDELLEAAIARIESRNPLVNAVINKLYDQARAQLDQLHPQQPLYGAPFLLQDLNAEVRKTPTSAGSRLFCSRPVFHDCELVQRYRRAGLVIAGKTNTAELGLAMTTEPQLFGASRNPWDLSRSPGGSSGGAAAAVAVGMAPVAHAVDIGGSLRTPAVSCGLFGFKPSRGREPEGLTWGRRLQGMAVDHVISRSVRDSAMLLSVSAGLDKTEQCYRRALTGPRRPLRIAICEKPFFSATLNNDSLLALDRAAMVCEDMGHEVIQHTLSLDEEELTQAYLTIVAGETAQMVRQVSPSGRPRRGDLELATHLLFNLGLSKTAAEFAWATQVMNQAGRRLEALFQQFDVLLTPAMAGPPARLGELAPSQQEKLLLELARSFPMTPLLNLLAQNIRAKSFSLTPFSPLFNMGGQPAMMLPVWWNQDDLPIGVQFAAGIGQERLLFSLAAQMERALPWFHRRPPLAEPADLTSAAHLAWRRTAGYDLGGLMAAEG
ncbi:amidase [Hahella aquimaris]|uniref:amidase n=1 Tax=Hahella sp. HNIBRBA332 TaxID=3015983 RepID=UPI00273AA43F|nr:amidase [Hahella sp. HNIBRBA332]WLQ13481.1 amidase [Hahella sp. HNIBRBA332]